MVRLGPVELQDHPELPELRVLADLPELVVLMVHLEHPELAVLTVHQVPLDLQGQPEHPDQVEPAELAV
jgi:hypothetical protein